MTDGNEPATGFFSGDLNHDMPGVTKREIFAAMAMQGFAAKEGSQTLSAPYRAAKYAVQFADALIEALNAKD